MVLAECNPFLRAGQIQPAVLEGQGLRAAYDYRIFYVLQNSGFLILEHEEYSLSPDTLILIPPRVGYHFRGKLKVAVLNFDLTRSCADRKTPLCPPPMAEFREECAFDRTVAEGFDKVLLRSGDLSFRQEVIDLVTRCEDDAWSSGALKRFLAEFCNRGEKSDPDRRLAERIGAYIRMHAAEISGNGELGAEFGYHPVYLGEVFKAYTGKTLHQAVTEERLKLACLWLTQTDRSVEQISFDTGFSSRSHFCTVFRKTFGISPSVWRKKQ